MCYSMCRADPTLYSSRWYTNECRDIVDWSRTHTCYDWDHLFNWTKTRSTKGMDVFRDHPLYGPGDKHQVCGTPGAPKQQLILGFGGVDGLEVEIKGYLDPNLQRE